MQASLDRIARGSALWRADRDSISMAGRRAIVLTPDAVVVVDPTGPGTPEPFGNNVLAEISVLPGSGSEVETVLVVVNLPLLTQAHDRRRSSAAERAADLDRILVHEVYGHAFPYLLAGSLSGRCADPLPGERPTDACSITRENAVRAELSLGRRIDYTLSSLTLAQPNYWLEPHRRQR